MVPISIPVPAIPTPVSNPDLNAHLKQSRALGRRRRRSPKFRRPQAGGKSRRRQKIRSRNEGSAAVVEGEKR
jgi:hypothetical protein